MKKNKTHQERKNDDLQHLEKTYTRRTYNYDSKKKDNKKEQQLEILD